MRERESELQAKKLINNSYIEFVQMDAMGCMVREAIQLNKLIKLLKIYFQVRKKLLL
jgi:hypothetical protein